MTSNNHTRAVALSQHPMDCPVRMDDETHRFHSAGSSARFRLRCNICRTSLNEEQSRRYIASLIESGDVPRRVIGLRTPTPR